jgi:hypothetical protein
MMNTLKSNHEHEERLAAMRAGWAEARENAARELEYAKRTVAALESMIYGFDAAVAGSSSSADGSKMAVGPIYNSTKSYEIGSGEKYPR